MVIYMGIGNKLDVLLSERDMTVTELARKANVAPTTIYSIIQRNNKKVDIDILIKISKILGVNAEYFSDIDEQPYAVGVHFDGTEYTAEELEKIKEYAAFLKARRK